MNVSIRPLLIPGVAVAMAVSPAVITPPALLAAPATVTVPTVAVPEIQLAGFAADLFAALDGWAQFAVQVAQDFFFWNPAIAEAIGGLYTTLQPIVAAVVTVIDSLATGPFDLLRTLASVGSSIFGLPNLLPAGATRTVSAAGAVRAAAAAGEQAATAAPERAEVAITRAEVPVVAEVPEVDAEVAAGVEAPTEAPTARAAGSRSAKTTSVRAHRQAPAAAAAQVVEQAQPAESDAPAPAARGAAKQTRGEAAGTARQARATR